MKLHAKEINRGMTIVQREQARREGWYVRTFEDGYSRIARMSNLPVFADDREASAYVHRRARLGASHALAALAMVNKRQQSKC